MDPHMDELGGFSMVKVVLSNALPRSVYDPCVEEDEGSDHHKPDPTQDTPPSA